MSNKTKTLTLFRHGKSDWGDPTLSDRERPLNPRGVRDVPKVAEQLKHAGLRPSLIVASAATRTWQTAQVIADTFGYPREFMHKEDDLYLATAATLAAFVAAQDNSFNSLIVCGHNPGISDFAIDLAPTVATDLPTSGVVTVTMETDSWAVLVSSPVTLLHHLTPKTLPGT